MIMFSLLYWIFWPDRSGIQQIWSRQYESDRPVCALGAFTI